MRNTADIAGSSLVPAVRYRYALTAIEWLCAAFGFHKHRVVTAEDGQFLHAHLTLGNAMVTVLPIRDFGLDLHMKQPDEIGGAETQTCYIHVSDIVAHHGKAKAAGAEIVLELRDDLHGGQGYSCRDHEGHIWSFGTYDPWEGAPPPAPMSAVSDAPPVTPGSMSRAGVNRLLVLAAVLVCITAAAAAGWMLQSNGTDPGLKREVLAARQTAADAAARVSALDAALARERGAKADAESIVRGVEEQLSREHAAKARAEQIARDAGRELLAERNARVLIDQRMAALSQQLDDERRAKEAVERDVAGTLARLGKEQAAKEAALSVSAAKAKELSQERESRQRAERSAKDALEQLARERRAREDAEEALRKLVEMTSQKGAPPSSRRTSSPASRPPEPAAKAAPPQSSPMPRVIP